jgi:hypothetical protein
MRKLVFLFYLLCCGLIIIPIGVVVDNKLFPTQDVNIFIVRCIWEFMLCYFGVFLGVMVKLEDRNK